MENNIKFYKDETNITPEINEWNDYYLGYLIKKMRAVTKKISHIHQLEKKRDQLKQEDLLKIEKRKDLEQELQELNNMKIHYEVAIYERDRETQDKFLTKQDIDYYQIANTLSQIIIYGNLSTEDTIVKQSLREVKHFQIFQEFKNFILSPFQNIDKTQTLTTIINRRTVEIQNMLKNSELNSYFQNVFTLKLHQKTLEQLKREIVLEVREEESDNQNQKIKHNELKEKNSSSEDSKNVKKTILKNYEGDQEVFTGQQDSKQGTPGDVKRKKVFNKKKGTKNTKKYMQEENYYASHQEQQKHKNYKSMHWRIKGGDHQFDTDKEKMVDDIIVKKQNKAGGNNN